MAKRFFGAATFGMRSTVGRGGFSGIVGGKKGSAARTKLAGAIRSTKAGFRFMAGGGMPRAVNTLTRTAVYNQNFGNFETKHPRGYHGRFRKK